MLAREPSPLAQTATSGLQSARFWYIECFYNPRRRHSSLGMVSLIDYEQRHQQEPSRPNDQASTETGDFQP
jgi:hypothetical protein